MWRSISLKSGLLLVFLASLIFAQNEETFVDQVDPEEYGDGARYARITYSERNVQLSRDGAPNEMAIRNMPIMAADFLKTPYRSYAEVEFIDGSLLQIDEDSEVEFQAVNELYRNESLTVMNLHDGSLFLHMTALDDSRSWDRRTVRVDTRAGSAYLEVPGVYRVDMSGGRMKLKVFRGIAELSGENETEVARSGEYSSVRDFKRPTRALSFNSFQADRFERWASDRRPGASSVSSKYVDPSIRSYTRDLDSHGEWRYSAEMGSHVWVPMVDSNWRPYYYGYWSPTSIALTWVSYDPFGWLTHHYGRWGWSVGFGWYWVPDRFYSPGWVSWTSYDDYLGWCPLGTYNRPYYWGRHGIDFGIYNRNRNSWYYLNARIIIRGERRLPERIIIAERPVRRVANRPIYLNRENRQDPKQLIRTIREPAVNREAAQAARERTGRIHVSRVDSAETTTRQSLPIEGRNTGTRAVSRTQLPIQRNGSSIFDDQTEVRRGGSGSSDGRKEADREGTSRGREDEAAPVRRGESGSNDGRKEADRNSTRGRGDEAAPVRRGESGSNDGRKEADREGTSRERDDEAAPVRRGESGSNNGRKEADREGTSRERDDEAAPVRRGESGSNDGRKEADREGASRGSEPQKEEQRQPVRREDDDRGAADRSDQSRGRDSNETQRAAPPSRVEPQRSAPPTRAVPQRTPPPARSEPKRAAPPTRSAPIKRDDGGGRTPVKRDDDDRRLAAFES